MGQKIGPLRGIGVGRHVSWPAPRRAIDWIGWSGGIVIVVLMLVGGPNPVVADPLSGLPAHNAKPDERLNFNIPSQPLTAALYAYTAVTGVEVLAASELLANRQSAEIRGTLTADQALQTLLAGTGLAAHFVDSGLFTLTPIQTPSASVPAADAPSDIPRYASYSTLLQNAVKRALCQQSETRPGYYRTAVQLWISPSGVVARSVLIGTTGDVDRDRALSDLFSALSIGAPPPAGLPQPATLLILPRSRAADCASIDSASRP